METSRAADYSVSTINQTIILTNLSGLADTLTVAEVSPGNIQFGAVGRTFSVDGGADMADNSGAISLTSATSVTVNGGVSADTINVGAFTTPLPDLTINGGAGDDVINLNGNIAFVPGASLDLDLQNDVGPVGTDAITVAANAQITASGMGRITLRASGPLALLVGARLETVNGNLTLEANQQTVRTAGSFFGVEVRGAIVRSTGTGLLRVVGTGGTTGTQQQGVNLSVGGSISGGGVGTTIVTGFGGLSTGSFNAGVHLQDANTAITSSGSDVKVSGTAGGTGASASNVGVDCATGSRISAGGNGSVEVSGVGGDSTASQQYGVSLNGANTLVTSSGGNVSVSGTGGGTVSSGANYGVYVTGAAKISAGVNGNVSVVGQGGNSTGSGASNYGVIVYGVSGTEITSSGGNVTVDGTGGGATTSGSNYGVWVYTPGQITVGGSGSITATGRGGSGSGGSHYGFYIYGSGATVASNGGNVSVTGIGGGKTASGGTNTGVFMYGSGAILARGGNISVTAVAGGGATSSSNRGLQLQSSGISTTGNGTISISGTGGGGTGNSHGARVVAGGTVTAESGDISVAGFVTDGTTASQAFTLSNAAGNGGKIQTSGNIAAAANTMAISSSGVSMVGSFISLRPQSNGTPINFGSTVDNTPATLELSNAEIGVVTCGTLILGDVNSGAITVSAPITPTGFSTLALRKNTTFMAASSFAASVGPTGASYKRITVNGSATIANGASFSVASTGGYVWNGSDSFTFLSSSSPITGTFSGPTLTNFLSSGLTASQNYIVGDFIVGPALTPLQIWRQRWYGTTNNTGNASDTAAPYGNQIPNLVVFAFFGPDGNPQTVNPSQLPQPQISGDSLTCQFTEPAGVSGITYHGESSTSLSAGTWQSVADSGVAPQHIFQAPILGNQQLFFRFRITAP